MIGYNTAGGPHRYLPRYLMDRDLKMEGIWYQSRMGEGKKGREGLENYEEGEERGRGG